MLFKRIIFCFAVFFFVLDAWGAVLNPDGTPLPEVIKIFKKFPLHLGKHLEEKPSLQTLNKIGQEKFLRPPGTERVSKEAIAHYQQLSDPLSPQDQTDILGLFKKIGDIDAVDPVHQHPNYIFVQGSTIPSIRRRIMLVASLVERQKIVLSPQTKIVFLMGDRPLFDSETKEVLLNPEAPFSLREGWEAPEVLPKNELELGEFAWDQLNLPSSLREKTPQFVKAEKKPGAPRAQTEDCVKKWIETNELPEKSIFLVISENPFVYYQTRITELMFEKLGYRKKTFTFDAAGNAAPMHEVNGKQPIAIGILMDNLARTLFTEMQFLK